MVLSRRLVMTCAATCCAANSAMLRGVAKARKKQIVEAASRAGAAGRDGAHLSGCARQCSKDAQAAPAVTWRGGIIAGPRQLSGSERPMRRAR